MVQLPRIHWPLCLLTATLFVLFPGQTWAGKATPMSADEIKKQLIGRTAIGIERETRTAMRLYFAPDGKVVANTHKGINEGTWKLDEQGRLRTDTGVDKHCFRMIKKKKTYVAVANHESGKPKVLMTFRKIYSGNLADHNRPLKERNITLNRRRLHAIYKKVFPKVNKGTRIAIRNGYTESNWITASFETAFGSEMVFHYDMKHWTDILVYILKEELKKRGFIVDDKAKRVITLRITDFRIEIRRDFGKSWYTFEYKWKKIGQDRYIRLGLWSTPLDGKAENGVHYMTKIPKLAGYRTVLKLEVQTGGQPVRALTILTRPAKTYKNSLNFASCTAVLGVITHRPTQKYLGLSQRPMFVKIINEPFFSERHGRFYFRGKIISGGIYLPGPDIYKPCD